MKAWTLIGFYLLKDIWRRWFETPGGVLSRLLVAFLLALLLLVIDASFTISAASIQQKLSQLGIRTIILSQNQLGNSEQRDQLFESIKPLSRNGTLLRLRQSSLTAEDELGNRVTVYTYGPEMLEYLSPGGDGSSFLISSELPAGMVSPVRLENGGEFSTTSIVAPSWFEKFGNNNAAVFLPEENAEEFLQRGFLEMIVFLGDDDTDLNSIEEHIQVLLHLEELNRVRVSSPKNLLNQLDQIEETQKKWQGGFGLFGGLAVALVFGSIAILEYRQNRYIVALLRSFGTPSLLLIGRYLIEAIILVSVSILLARAAAIAIHPTVFQTIGIDRALIDRNVIDPYSWTTIWQNLRWLGLGALLSILPVTLALRTPVGKILA